MSCIPEKTAKESAVPPKQKDWNTCQKASSLKREEANAALLSLLRRERAALDDVARKAGII